MAAVLRRRPLPAAAARQGAQDAGHRATPAGGGLVHRPHVRHRGRGRGRGGPLRRRPHRQRAHRRTEVGARRAAGSGPARHDGRRLRRGVEGLVGGGSGGRRTHRRAGGPGRRSGSMRRAAGGAGVVARAPGRGDAGVGAARRDGLRRPRPADARPRRARGGRADRDEGAGRHRGSAARSRSAVPDCLGRRHRHVRRQRPRAGCDRDPGGFVRVDGHRLR